MTIPKWLSTTASVVLLVFIGVAYLVVRSPGETKHSSVVTNHPAFTHSINIGGFALNVAFASSAADAELGLSNTAPLAPDQGMLFFFPDPVITAFWMKDMNYPLDIIWIGADKTVKNVTANLDPNTYPATFSPKEPVQYVLEVSAGFAEKNGITAGTQISF